MLFEACEKGRTRQVKEALAAGVSVNVRDQRGNWLGATPLMHATKAGQSECVKVLLAAAADPNLVDRPIPLGGGKRTALYFAAQNRNIELVALLLDAKANVNAVSHDTTALGWAVSNGDMKLALLLLQSGAIPNLSNKTDGMNPLHIACIDRKQKMATLLIDAGANVDAQCAAGKTSLMRALFSPVATAARWR